MAEGLIRTAGTAGLFANAKAQPSRCEALRVVVLGHQPRRLGLNDLSARSQELSQKLGKIRRGSMSSSPGGSKLPPVGTVPIPLLGLRIAPSLFWRGPLL